MGTSVVFIVEFYVDTLTRGSEEELPVSVRKVCRVTCRAVQFEDKPRRSSNSMANAELLAIFFPAKDSANPGAKWWSLFPQDIDIHTGHARS